MQKLALTFVLASAAAALASISTTPRPNGVVDESRTLAMACCDDPPPPCWPSPPDCDKSNPPSGDENLKSTRE